MIDCGGGMNGILSPGYRPVKPNVRRRLNRETCRFRFNHPVALADLNRVETLILNLDIVEGQTRLGGCRNQNLLPEPLVGKRVSAGCNHLKTGALAMKGLLVGRLFLDDQVGKHIDVNGYGINYVVVFVMGHKDGSQGLVCPGIHYNAVAWAV